MNANRRTLLAAVVTAGVIAGVTAPTSASPPPVEGPRAVVPASVDAGTGAAGKREPALPAAAATITYQPPLRGAPSRRVIAGTRGGTSTTTSQ